MRSVTVKRIPRLDEYGERIAVLPVGHVEVELTTSKPVAYTDLPTLDGVLAAAVVRELFQNERFLHDPSACVYQPLPLGLEREIDGLPLWRSTNFFPVGEWAEYRTHIHKRTEANPYRLAAVYGTLDAKSPRRSPSSVAGQYMDYRIPVRAVMSERFVARCVGNADEIRRLLIENVTALGRHRAAGFGSVLEWKVTVVPGEFSFHDEDGVPLRPIPIQTGFGTFQGWTPPYWHRAAWRLCENATTGRLRISS